MHSVSDICNDTREEIDIKYGRKKLFPRRFAQIYYLVVSVKRKRKKEL